MLAIRRLTLVAIAAALGACDLSIEVHPGDGLEGYGARTEAQWRSQALSIERRIERLERQIEQKRDEKWDLPASFDPAVEAQAEWFEREIEQLEAQLEQAQDDLASLEAQAREAEVPPGWLR
jgi:septal ring factor EnvC (AmiA/AmiB activator)